MNKLHENNGLSLTFSFLDNMALVECSRVNRVWHRAVTRAIKKVYQARFNYVINWIRGTIENVPKMFNDNEKMFKTECQNLASINLSFGNVNSLLSLSRHCAHVQHLMKMALLNLQEAGQIIDSQPPIEEASIVEKRAKRFGRNTQLTHLLSLLFGEFYRQNRLEEALIVARLIPTERDFYVYHKETVISDSLRSICIAFIAREKIGRAFDCASEIPSIVHRNQVYLRIVQFWIAKQNFQEALKIAHCIQDETPRPIEYKPLASFLERQHYTSNDGISNRRYVAYEIIAEALCNLGMRKEAQKLINLIPDHDYDGCKHRLINLIKPSQCIIS